MANVNSAVKVLFPPVLDTFMPAFIKTAPCRVYFALPTYNTVRDIKNVQISMNNQNNNITALSKELYPSGIKIADITLDSSRDGDDKYYVTVTPQDLEDGIFATNQFYKVQLRFTSRLAPDPPQDNKIANWLTVNQDFFSEWSKVCLIKGISLPEITIKGLDSNTGNKDIVLATQVLDFVGRLYYNSDDGEQEFLDNYQIKVYNTNDLDEPYMDSGIIYTDPYAPNEINYTFAEELIDGSSYVAKFSYITNNGYADTINFNFSVVLYDIDQMKVEITSTPDEENGRITVNIHTLTGERFTGNLTIRRTSSESDFALWEDVYTTSIATGEVLDITWQDYTIESGVWYRYGVQKRNGRGDRGVITRTKKPVLCYFENVFLNEDKKQIKIKYDPQISSFKRTIYESKTDTIGGTYPVIRRNGQTDYKQFPISGLITAYQDDDHLFTNPDELFGTSKELYQEFNSERRIGKAEDVIYEREFREKIVDFLYDSQPKLFRSVTEGNILVKLMDVNLTPNQVLGRRLYSFSATAYEIGPADINHMSKYNIQDVGGYRHNISVLRKTLGQLHQNFDSKINKDIILDLQNEYKQRSNSGFVPIVKHLTWLRVQFLCDPVLWKKEGDQWVRYLDGNQPVPKDRKIMLGYVIVVNGKQIFVDPEIKMYELADGEVDIYSFRIETGGMAQLAVVDYIAMVEERESYQDLASRFYYYHKTGQLRESFPPEINQSYALKARYALNYDSFYQYLTAITGLTIWAPQNTVVYIKDSEDRNFNRFVIGEDEVLEFYKPDAIIEDFYFAGMHLMPLPTNRNICLPNEYIPDTTVYFNKAAAGPPVENKEYRFHKPNSIIAYRTVFMNGEYRELDYTYDDVKIPIDAMVDYHCDVLRGEY